MQLMKCHHNTINSIIELNVNYFAHKYITQMLKAMLNLDFPKLASPHGIEIKK